MTKEIISMTMASAVAPTTSYCSSLEMINSGVISEISGMLPAMKMTEPYSPIEREKASVKPVNERRQERRQEDSD
jgi:hypothetical protein